jgi:multiple sugar transport system permease protein/sorbitol/mannitol transport system permease protein
MAPVLRRAASIAARAAVWLWITLAMVPLLFMLVTSVKPSGLAVSVPPVWRFTPTLDNYSDLINGNTASSGTFLPLVQNSAIVALGSTLLAIGVGLPAAYALTLSRFGARKFLSSWILSTIMFPPIVAVIPVFILAGKLNMIDTYAVLIIPYAAFNLPMVIWILRSTIRQIPEEVEQAALVDGASRAGVLIRVILPLIMPGIATAAILSIVLAWNEFLFALSLTRSAAKTGPVAVSVFTGQFGTQWGYLTAASTIIVAPILVLVLILRRRFVSGLSFGAVK